MYQSIAYTNDFNQAQALKELNAQVTITTEFGKEAPKAVAEFADKQTFKLIQNLDELNDKNIDITFDEYQNTIKEIDKWSKGGIYRVALHTAATALATGTAQGGLSAGTTAYAIPKIDEYLQQQGYDEDTRNAVLVGLSAGIGGAVGDNTAGVANSINQTENNYLTHKQMDQWIADIISCGKDKACIERKNKFWAIQSEVQQEDLINICVKNYNRAGCDGLRKEYSDAQLKYHPKLEKVLGAGARAGTYKSSFDAVFQVQQIDNPQAEQIWLNNSRDNPSNKPLDNIGWAMAQNQANKTSILGGGIAKNLSTSKRTTSQTTKVTTSNSNKTSDEIFSGKAPHQTTPGINYRRQERYNPKTKQLEVSHIYYDQYGRQVKRIDETNHGYGDKTKPKEYHSIPHTHTYEYGPSYGNNGKETRTNH